MSLDNPPKNINLDNKHILRFISDIEANLDLLNQFINNSSKSDNTSLIAAVRQLEEGLSLIRSIKYSLEVSERERNLTSLALGSLLSELHSKYKKRAIEQGIVFYLCLDSPVPKWVKIDKDLLLVCINQVLERAFYLTDQGRITLKLRHLVEESELRIEVLDTGLSQCEIAQSSSYSAVVSLTEMLEKELGNKLKIESLEGVGTKVVLSIPISEHSTDSIVHTSDLPRLKINNLDQVDQKLRRISGTIIGMVRTRAYRDVIRSYISFGKCKLHLCQSQFQFRDFVFSTLADIILIEGLNNQEEVLKLVQEIRVRQINTPILVLHHVNNIYDSNTLARYGVESVQLPFELHNFVDILTRYLPANYDIEAQSSISEVVMPSKETIKESLAEGVDQEQADNISRFISNLPYEMRELEELLHKADLSKGAFMANEIGGAAYFVGLQNIGEELLALEQAAKSGLKNELFLRLNNAKKLIENISVESHAPPNKDVCANQKLSNVETKEEIQPATEIYEVVNSERDPIVSSVIAESPELLPLVIDFLSSLDDYIEKIYKAIDNNNWEALSRSCHETSGVAGMYGYLDLSIKTKKLQHIAENKDPGEVKEVLSEIVEIIADMKRGKELMAP